MARVQNKDLLNSIREEQSLEYQERVAVATGSNDLEIYATLEAYPTVKNEFINTLTNKVGKTLTSCSIDESVEIFNEYGVPSSKIIPGVGFYSIKQKSFLKHLQKQ